MQITLLKSFTFFAIILLLVFLFIVVILVSFNPCRPSIRVNDFKKNLMVAAQANNLYLVEETSRAPDYSSYSIIKKMYIEVYQKSHRIFGLPEPKPFLRNFVISDQTNDVKILVHGFDDKICTVEIAGKNWKGNCPLKKAIDSASNRVSDREVVP